MFTHYLFPTEKIGRTSDLESLLQPEGMECGVAMIRDGYNAGISTSDLESLLQPEGMECGVAMIRDGYNAGIKK